jgi:hypothetical protein
MADGTELVTQEQPSAPTKAPVAFGGAAPTDVEGAWRFSKILSESGIVPEDFRGKPANVFVALQLGAELGLAPMQALQSICVINGRPSIWGDGFIALLIKSPAYADHEEYYETAKGRTDRLTADDLKNDATAAVCTMWRVNKAQPVTRRFTIAQAKKAELWTKKGPWQTYPDRMLLYKARNWAGRDLFPDVLRGLVSAEEALEKPDITERPPARVMRLSEQPPAEAVVDAPPMITLDPACVKDIQQFLGGYTVTLDNGLQADVTEAVDARALEELKGTPTKVQLTVRRVADTLQLETFVTV